MATHKVKDATGFRSEPLKGYVEQELKDRVLAYARRHGLTDSQAVRKLVRVGLAVELRRERVALEAIRQSDADAEGAESQDGQKVA